MDGWSKSWRCAAAALVIAESAAAQDSVQFRHNDLRFLNGTNLNWILDGDGLELSRPDRPYPRADSLVRGQQYTAVRLPGGSLARHFDWRLAIDTPRGRSPDFTGRLQPITTGLPELKRFAARYGMGVLYIVNINDDASSVLDLLRRWTQVAPAGRNIERIELGNEDYIYDGGSAGAARYVARVKPLIHAIRAQDAHLKIGAQLADPLQTGWDEVVRRELDTLVDFWTWHRYFPYTSYDPVGSYAAVVEATRAFDRDVAERTRSSRHPVWLTEYNFMFYQGREYQNVGLQPRYYLLFANLYHSAIKHGIPAMFKCCLVNPWFQALVDIDSASFRTIGLSLSGEASGFMNRWLSRQDSVAAVGADDGFRHTLSAGKSSQGELSFLAANHSAALRRVRLPVPAGYAWRSSYVIFQQGDSFAYQALSRRQGGGADTTLPPYSLTVIEFAKGGQ